jgi:hypothetical protein
LKNYIQEYFENLYSSKLKNLDEMDKFLDAYNQPKLNQEYINHLNGPIACNEIEAIIKSLPTNKSTRPDRFIAESIKPLKKN